MVLAVIAGQRLGRVPAARAWVDRLSLRLPIAGRVASMVVYSRLASALATLLSSGVQLDRALQLAEHAVGNRVVAAKVRRVRDRVQGGETLTEALENTGGFPALLIRMVRVGESCGDLAGMLHNCNDHYEREIPRQIRKALAAGGPLLVLVLGAMVVWVALSIFMPLLQIGTALK